MIKSMENNFTKNTIHIDQIIEDDGLLSILKDKRQEFSLADICLPSNPKESGFLFIKLRKLFKLLKLSLILFSINQICQMILNVPSAFSKNWIFDPSDVIKFNTIFGPETKSNKHS